MAMTTRDRGSSSEPAQQRPRSGTVVKLGTAKSSKYGTKTRTAKRSAGAVGQDRRPPESFQSLLVYTTLVRAGRACTARELLDETSLADGTLYPILQKRINAGLVQDGTRDGRSSFELTPEGYRHASSLLERLQIDIAVWRRAEATYGGPT